MKTSKVNKVLVIIIFSLLIVLGISTYVLYLINPKAVTDYFNWFVDILNKPLPIIGVTTLALLVFVWKVVVATNYGKAKLKIYEDKLKQIEQAKDDLEKAADEKIKELKEENDKLRAQLIHACELSTNKKLNDFGKELENYGEENSNCTTKTN